MEENKIQTAKEYSNIYISLMEKKVFEKQEDLQGRNLLAEAFIEFAKVHVKAALYAASKQEAIGYETTFKIFDKSQQQIIINSYPLENIK